MKSVTKGVEVLWQDTKRILGFPISFTKYAILRKPGQWVKLVEESGVLSTNVEEVMLYRVDDLGVYQSVTNKMFGVGNVEVYCHDASIDVLVLKNIKKPHEVKALLSDLIEEERKHRNVRYSEVQY